MIRLHKILNEVLLKEGGAYGHMNHPFDTEINLTFGQLKDIVNRALDGNLELAREKTDGQALAISWVGGRLVAARNKGHLKNKGAGALDIKGVADKFTVRGELEKADNFAKASIGDTLVMSYLFSPFSKILDNIRSQVIPDAFDTVAYSLEPYIARFNNKNYVDKYNFSDTTSNFGKILHNLLKRPIDVLLFHFS